MSTALLLLALAATVGDDPEQATPPPPAPVEETPREAPAAPPAQAAPGGQELPPPDDAWPSGLPAAVGSAAGCGLAGGIPLLATAVLGIIGLVYLAAAYTICPCFIIQAVLFLGGAGAAGVVAGPLASGGACVGAGVAGLFTARFWQGLVGAIGGVLVGLAGSAVLLSTLVVISDEFKAATGIDGTTTTIAAGGLLAVGVLLVAVAGPVAIGGASLADFALAPAARPAEPSAPVVRRTRSPTRAPLALVDERALSGAGVRY